MDVVKEDAECWTEADDWLWPHLEGAREEDKKSARTQRGQGVMGSINKQVNKGEG